MSEMSYTPKRKGKLPEILTSGCFVLMAMSLVFLCLSLGNRTVMELLFLVSAAVAVYTMTRYLTRTFIYRVEQMEYGDATVPVFTVTQKNGRRLTCLCRLDLTTLYRLRPYTKSDDEKATDLTRYRYCNSPNPDPSYLLFFQDGDKRVSIRVELEGEFLSCLTKIAAYNATRGQGDSEE